MIKKKIYRLLTGKFLYSCKCINTEVPIPDFQIFNKNQDSLF